MRYVAKSIFGNFGIHYVAVSECQCVPPATQLSPRNELMPRIFHTKLCFQSPNGLPSVYLSFSLYLHVGADKLHCHCLSIYLKLL